MAICYWCYWGWPKPIRDIYDDCREQMGGDDHPLLYGPAHVVWADENWDCAQSCLDDFDRWCDDLSGHEQAVVRESLLRLLRVPDEYKCPPEDYDNANPAAFPPPPEWEVAPR